MLGATASPGAPGYSGEVGRAGVSRRSPAARLTSKVAPSSADQNMRIPRVSSKGAQSRAIFCVAVSRSTNGAGFNNPSRFRPELENSRSRLSTECARFYRPGRVSPGRHSIPAGDLRRLTSNPTAASLDRRINISAEVLKEFTLAQIFHRSPNRHKCQ